MEINGINLFTATIEELKALETSLVESVIIAYDHIDIMMQERTEQDDELNINNDIFLLTLNNTIRRDMFKLAQVKSIINRRFQHELLEVMYSVDGVLNRFEDQRLNH